jgi:CDP-diacylglycerol---glycerol-3-phosphate 3-phosphatidyltransferase
MARVGLTPNMLTLIGFAIASVAAVLAGVQWWAAAGIVGTAGAAFDAFDGAVARVTGKASPFGAFMDSTFDRWGEGLLYVGIVIGATQAGVELAAWLSAAAMTSAFLVSYTRARAESLGFSSGRGMAAIGLAPREVRVVILGLGLVLAGLLGVAPGTSGTLVLEAALGLITLLATVTIIQRIVFVHRQSQQSEVTR